MYKKCQISWHGVRQSTYWQGSATSQLLDHSLIFSCYKTYSWPGIICISWQCKQYWANQQWAYLKKRIHLHHIGRYFCELIVPVTNGILCLRKDMDLCYFFCQAASSLDVIKCMKCGSLCRLVLIYHKMFAHPGVGILLLCDSAAEYLLQQRWKYCP